MNTYTDKQVRKLEKKARHAEGRYHETQDEEYLRKRDRFNDEVNILKRNVAMNKKNKKKKENDEQKTDDQLINEAFRQNRRERNEREKVANEREKKRKEVQNKRNNVKVLMKAKKVKKEKEIEENKKLHENMEKERMEYIQGCIKDNVEGEPTHKDYSNAQKSFIKDFKMHQEMKNFKVNIIKYMVSQGLNEEEAESEFENMFNKENRTGITDETQESTITTVS